MGGFIAVIWSIAIWMRTTGMRIGDVPYHHKSIVSGHCKFILSAAIPVNGDLPARPT